MASESDIRLFRDSPVVKGFLRHSRESTKAQPGKNIRPTPSPVCSPLSRLSRDLQLNPLTPRERKYGSPSLYGREPAGGCHLTVSALLLFTLSLILSRQGRGNSVLPPFMGGSQREGNRAHTESDRFPNYPESSCYSNSRIARSCFFFAPSALSPSPRSSPIKGAEARFSLPFGRESEGG